MIRLNNRGQSLVMFILIIPIFLLIMTLVYDVGNAIYEKNKLSNVSYMTIQYGLDNIESIDENELISLIMKNVDNPKLISVLIENGEIEIKSTKDVKGIIGKMFNFDLITVVSEYHGEIINGKKVIERIK